MPYVQIKILDQAVTKTQKAELIKKTISMLHEVLNKSPESTYVVIEEVDKDNWGVGGVPVSQRK